MRDAETDAQVVAGAFPCQASALAPSSESPSLTAFGFETGVGVKCCTIRVETSETLVINGVSCRSDLSPRASPQAPLLIT